MKRLPRSSAYRIAFATCGAFALAIILIGAIVFYAAHASFARQMDANIDGAQTALLAEYRAERLDGLIEAIGRRQQRSGDELGYALFDKSGRHVAGDLDLPRPTLGWSHVVFDDPEEGQDPARALTTSLDGGEWLVVAADLEPLERIDATILTIFAFALAAIAMIGTAGALLLGAYLRRRLSRITLTADAIIGGAFDQRVQVGDRIDEFDLVAIALNQMLDRIATLVVNLRQVSSDIAHDLRTPLGRMRSLMERARIEDGDAVSRRIALESAIAQSDEIWQIFEAMLRIAEIEEGAARRGFETVDLGALVAEIVDSFQPVAEEEEHLIEAKGEPGCLALGDRRLIGQVLVNLVENALRHTPPGTRITVGTIDRMTSIQLFVADDGPGVPATERARIFERFVRLDSARSRPGHGLGLSMVAAIADLHSTTLAAQDASPGLMVSLIFPKEHV